MPTPSIPQPDIHTQISELSAKVTALIMLVEALYVDEFARGPNPEIVAEAIIQSVDETEKKARDAVGESAYSLQISEMISALIRRAGERAKSRQSKEGRR